MLYKKGLLYVRVFNGNPEDLFYPTEDVQSDYLNFHVENIARMRYGKAEPSFGGALECAKHGELSGAGYLIEFAESSDQYLEMFLTNWDSRVKYPFEEWFENLKYCEELLPEEKARLKILIDNLS